MRSRSLRPTRAVRRANARARANGATAALHDDAEVARPHPRRSAADTSARPDYAREPADNLPSVPDSRKTTEDLLAGFDRTGRTPRAPRTRPAVPIGAGFATWRRSRGSSAMGESCSFRWPWFALGAVFAITVGVVAPDHAAARENGLGRSGAVGSARSPPIAAHRGHRPLLRSFVGGGCLGISATPAARSPVTASARGAVEAADDQRVDFVRNVCEIKEAFMSKLAHSAILSLRCSALASDERRVRAAGEGRSDDGRGEAALRRRDQVRRSGRSRIGTIEIRSSVVAAEEPGDSLQPRAVGAALESSRRGARALSAVSEDGLRSEGDGAAEAARDGESGGAHEEARPDRDRRADGREDHDRRKIRGLGTERGSLSGVARKARRRIDGRRKNEDGERRL